MVHNMLGNRLKMTDFFMVTVFNYYLLANKFNQKTSLIFQFNAA